MRCYTFERYSQNIWSAFLGEGSEEPAEEPTGEPVDQPVDADGDGFTIVKILFRIIEEKFNF